MDFFLRNHHAYALQIVLKNGLIFSVTFDVITQPEISWIYKSGNLFNFWRNLKALSFLESPRKHFYIIFSTKTFLHHILHENISTSYYS